MVRLTRIYTRGGDKGKTSLGNGSRVLKSSLRIEAIGAIDEANASLGLLRAFLSPSDPCLPVIKDIQNDLFDIGADLCYPSSSKTSSSKPALRLTQKKITQIEQWIDQLNLDLTPLTSFVLPGGSQTAAFCHQARTLIRRAERQIVNLSQKNSVNPLIIQYTNRLSDLLFVLGRILNNKGKEDILWIPGGKKEAVRK